VTAAKHTPPSDPSFRRSLARNAAGAVGLVVLVAAIFGVLGMIGRADTDLDIADVPEEPAAPAEDPDDDPAEPAPAEPPAEEPPPAEEEPADEPAEEAPDEEPEEPAEPAEPEEPAPDAIDPGDISVQVLDGYRQDGGAAATAVFEQLQAAGYRIVARNPAIAYQTTTVFWSPGSEDKARQVAREIDAPVVEEKPADSLSDQVDVHVVVGADRG